MHKKERRNRLNMKSLNQLIKQANNLLDELIQTAKKLKVASQQSVSEEELDSLQKKQEDLLIQFEGIDQDLQQYNFFEISEAVHQQFHIKLQEFQTLNQEFIETLQASHGLIQFELRQLKEENPEGFFSPLRRLQKISFTPRRSQTIKPEEDEKS